jgi:hypothetical protein
MACPEWLARNGLPEMACLEWLARNGLPGMKRLEGTADSVAVTANLNLDGLAGIRALFTMFSDEGSSRKMDPRLRGDDKTRNNAAEKRRPVFRMFA